jgi:hypothetical protein
MTIESSERGDLGRALSLASNVNRTHHFLEIFLPGWFYNDCILVCPYL